MPLDRLVIGAILAWLVCTSEPGADELRYFEQNGITYCEVRRTAPPQRPQPAAAQDTRVVLREQVTSEIRQTVRTYWTPVTEYRWESSWVNRWNPFAEPYRECRCVPRTRWEKRSEVVPVPVACRRLVPERQTTSAPATAVGTAPGRIVTRLPASGLPVQGSFGPADAAETAQRIPYGGMSRLDNQPPRFGQNPAW